MNELSRHPTSVYQAIAAQLEQEVLSRYQSGDYLPPEQQLATRFAVNRHTLRRAVDELVSKGLVLRRPGVGVLVLMHSVNYPHYTRARFSHDLRQQVAMPPANACWRCCVRPARSGGRTGLQEGEQVIHLRTLRRMEGVPVCVTNHFLPQLARWPQLQHYRSGALHDFCSSATSRLL